MERKSAAGSIRNKERSKKKFLDAVGKILKTKGYAGLKVNDIAATAGVDKKMIYTYFGGMDGLIDEYIRSQDYWIKVTTDKIDKIIPGINDGEYHLSKKCYYHSLIMCTLVRKHRSCYSGVYPNPGNH